MTRITDAQRSMGARNVARQQRERVKEVIHRVAPVDGVTVPRIARLLLWQRDTARAWVEELLNLGEIQVRAGDEGYDDPRYITVEDAIAARSQGLGAP